MRLVAGSDVHALSDWGGVGGGVGDYVAVERRQFNSPRRVGSVFCETPEAARFDDHRWEAERRLAVRQELLDTSSDGAMDGAARRCGLCDG